MLLRTALALLLLLPAAAPAQELDAALNAVVKISGTRGGVHVQGSGFVVGLGPGKATIVTASHVIEGLQEIEVTFAADVSERFPADPLLGSDSENRNGLAVFQVRGAIPRDVRTLSFDTDAQLQRGEDLFLLGFPEMTTSPLTLRANFAGPNGNLLQLDRGVGEGLSGGPVLRKGKVVGVVTSTDPQLTFAVRSLVARDAVAGWPVKLGGQSANPLKVAETKSQPPPPPVMGACQSGKEERVANGIGFVRICAGTFTMGSRDNDPRADADEKPAHEGTLSEFWIAKTETTNVQYRKFRPTHQGEPDLPVGNVSWEDAEAACQHFGGRLPTEAEWEYAARAGTDTAWSFGDDEKLIGEYAWYKSNSGGDPHPVGKKKPNDWGLYDMHGNVWEWVSDWYDTYPTAPETDPQGPATGKFRVLRGGSFIFTPGDLRSAFRFWFLPEFRDRNVGFRCVSSPRRQP